MLSARLLNSEASLNSFFEIDGIPYVPGQNLDIVVQLLHSERGIRLIPPNGTAIITLIFTNKTNPPVPLSIVATEVSAADRSMWKVSLSQAQTVLISGSNIEITYDVSGDGVTLFKSVIRGVLLKTLLSGC